MRAAHPGHRLRAPTVALAVAVALLALAAPVGLPAAAAPVPPPRAPITSSIVDGSNIIRLEGGDELAVQGNDRIGHLAVDPRGNVAAATVGTWLDLYDLRAGALLGSRQLVADKGAPQQLGGSSFAGSGRWLLVRTAAGASLLDLSRERVVGDFASSPPALGASVTPSLTLPVAFSRDANVGVALLTSGLGRELASLEVKGPGKTAAVRVTGRWPLPAPCLEGPIGAAAIDARGHYAALRCTKTLVEIDLARGRIRSVSLPPSFLKPATGTRRLYVTQDGRRALVVSGKSPDLRAAWVDFRHRSVSALKARPVSAILGVFGRRPSVALVVHHPTKRSKISWEIRALDPAGALRWRVVPPASASSLPPTYAESAGVFVGTATSSSGPIGREWLDSGLLVFDRKGTVVERFGSQPATIQALLPDGSGHRLYLSCGFERYLDLADGAARQFEPHAKRTRAPASLIGLDLGSLYTHDCRDRSAIAIKGLTGKDGEPTKPGVVGLWRSSERWFLARTKRRVAVVDLEKRRVDRWFDRPHADELWFGFVSPTNGDVLLLDRSGKLEVFDRSGRRVTTRQTHWSADKDAGGPLAGMLALRSGMLVAFGDAGIEVAPSTRHPDFRPVLANHRVWKMRLAPDGKSILMELWGQEIDQCPVGKQGLVLSRCTVLEDAFFPARFVAHGRRIVAHSSTGELVVSDAATGKPVAYIFVGRPGKRTGLLSGTVPTLIVTPDGRFAGTPSGYALAYRVHGLHARAMSVADTRDNRPSVVLARIGVASADALSAYGAIEKRLSKGAATAADGGGAPPSIEIDHPPPLTTNARVLRVRVTVHPGASPPSHLEVRVNGLPIFGREGVRLSARGSTVRRTLTIPLGPGQNRISLDAVDTAGRSGFGRTFIVTTRAHFPPPRVFYVGVGVSDYGDPEHDLTYAAKDVGDVADALRQLFGDAAHIRLLTNTDATRANVMATKRFLDQSGMGDLVLVYLAGHGLLDTRGDYVFGTRGVDFAHPDRGGLAYADIENLVAGVRSAGTVVLLDSCHAGGTTGVFKPLPGAAGGVRVKARGAAPIVPAKVSDDLALTRAFSVLRPGIGATVIASAEKDELAYESQSVHNGLFTHALITSLLGYDARNPRGELWLSDLLAGVRQDVVKLTGGAQRPVLRSGNLSFQRPLVAATPLKTVVEGPPKMYLEGSFLDDTGRRLILISKHRLVVEGFPDGKPIASTKVKLGRPRWKSCSPLVSPTTATLGPGAKWLELSGCTGIDRVDLATHDWVHIADAPEEFHDDIATSPDGRYVVWCSSSRAFDFLDAHVAHPHWQHEHGSCSNVRYVRRLHAFLLTSYGSVWQLHPATGRVEELKLPKRAHEHIERWSGAADTETVALPSADGRQVLIATIADDDHPEVTSHLAVVTLATGRVGEARAKGPVTWEVVTRSGLVVLAAPFATNGRPVRVVDARHRRLSMWPQPRGESFEIVLQLGDRVIGHGDWGSGFGFRILGRNVFQVLRTRDGEPLGSFTGNGSLIAQRGRFVYSIDTGGDILRMTLPQAEARRGPRHH